MKLLAMALLLAATGDVEVSLTRERRAVAKPPKAVGNDFVETRLALGDFRLWHRVAVDPKRDDAPVRFGYGEFFFGCDFGCPVRNGGWNRWHFTTASVLHPKRGKRPVGLYRRVEGFYVVERGPRGVADVVWWLAGGPERGQDDLVTMRFIKQAEGPKWCHIETSVETAGPASLAAVVYSAYPGATTGPPQRERWVTTAVRGHNLMKGGVELDAAREWAISLHNKHGDERAASLLVFDPDEIAKVRVSGTYGVTIALTPKPGRRAIHVGVSYFFDEPWQEGNAAFLRAAPQSLAELRKMNWGVDLERVSGAWRKEMAVLDEPLRHAVGEPQVAARVARLQEAFGTALAEARALGRAGKRLPRRAERRLGALLMELRDAKQAVFAAGVRGLLKDQK